MYSQTSWDTLVMKLCETWGAESESYGLSEAAGKAGIEGNIERDATLHGTYMSLP